MKPDVKLRMHRIQVDSKGVVFFKTYEGGASVSWVRDFDKVGYLGV